MSMPDSMLDAGFDAGFDAGPCRFRQIESNLASGIFDRRLTRDPRHRIPSTG
jgi:hypothetical protein